MKLLQAEVGRKQEMLQQLRERVDGLVGSAQERAALQEQERAQVTTTGGGGARAAMCLHLADAWL